MNITRLDRKDFNKLFALIEKSFPPEEYRKKEKQLALLDDKDYSVSVFKENNEISAFIAAWAVSDYLFIEHFAVSPELRNRGIGSLFVKTFLEQTIPPVVLEVENTEDVISLRRMSFYQRLGFILTDICYDQPNFQNTGTVIPLKIMYHPNGNTFDISRVKHDIFKKIYKLPNF